VRTVFANAGVDLDLKPHHECSSNVPVEHDTLPRYGFVREPVAWYRSWYMQHCRVPGSLWLAEFGTEVDDFISGVAGMNVSPPVFAEAGGFGKIHRDLTAAPPAAGQGFLDWLELRTFDTSGPDAVNVLKFENLRDEMANLVTSLDIGTVQQKKEMLSEFANYPPINAGNAAKLVDLRASHPATVTTIESAEATYMTRNGY
jgi:hypothetical protein